LKGRTTATMIISIGRQTSSLTYNPRAIDLSFCTSKSNRRGLGPTHLPYVFGYAQVRMCRFNYTILASMLNDRHNFQKILVLAIITTMVVPVDSLIFEAPPTPPCTLPFSYSEMFPSAESSSFSLFWFSHSVSIFRFTHPGGNRTKVPPECIHDLARTN
jgi:hypothetical protein